MPFTESLGGDEQIEMSSWTELGIKRCESPEAAGKTEGPRDVRRDSRSNWTDLKKVQFEFRHVRALEPRAITDFGKQIDSKPQ
jgi:hypothetical protein